MVSNFETKVPTVQLPNFYMPNSSLPTILAPLTSDIIHLMKKIEIGKPWGDFIITWNVKNKDEKRKDSDLEKDEAYDDCCGSGEENYSDSSMKQCKLCYSYSDKTAVKCGFCEAIFE